MNIYVVTANKQIQKLMENWGHHVKQINDTAELPEQMILDTSPDVIMLIEGGPGVSPEAAAELKKQYPDQRIIYIANKPDFSNWETLNSFISMADSGITDILCSGEIKPSMIRNLLDHSMTAEDIHFLYDRKKEMEDQDSNIKIV